MTTLLAHQATAGYAPDVDGRVLTQSIGAALAGGAFNRVPLIEGTNHDEWRFFVASAGASHAAELQYLFPTLGIGPLSQDRQRLSATMVGYWTQFAKTGDPNSNDAPAWPRYSAATDRFLSLAPPVPAAAGGFAGEHRCSLWEP